MAARRSGCRRRAIRARTTSRAWSGSTTGRLSIQQLNRLQNQNDFLIADARTGETRRVFRDESKIVGGRRRRRAVGRERPRVPVAERARRLASRLPRAARGRRRRNRRRRAAADHALRCRRRWSVAGLDEAGGWIYFIASPDNATQRYLYRSKLDGTGTPERVTPVDPARHAPLRRGAGRQDGVPHLLALRRAAGHRRRRAAGAHRAAPAHGHRGAREEGDAAGAAAGGVLHHRRGRWGDARRVDAEADALRRVEALPGDRVRLRRAGKPDGDRQLGRRPDAVPSRARRGRLHRRQRGQSRHAGAEGRGVAQGGVRRGRRAVREGAGRGRARADGA